MNKLTYYILSAILSVLFFSSCSDDEKAVPAAATLNAIKVTSHSLEFSLTPQHADQCAWMCYKKGETAPTAEDILNEGIPADKLRDKYPTGYCLRGGNLLHHSGSCCESRTLFTFRGS